jgi:hypothetical protein
VGADGGDDHVVLNLTQLPARMCHV